jgi:hypothetical protein
LNFNALKRILPSTGPCVFSLGEGALLTGWSCIECCLWFDPSSLSVWINFLNSGYHWAGVPPPPRTNS